MKPHRRKALTPGPWRQMALNVRAHPRTNALLAFVFLLLVIITAFADLAGPVVTVFFRLLALVALVVLLRRLNTPPSPGSNFRPVVGPQGVVPAIVIAVVIFFGVASLFALGGRFE